MTVLRQGKKNMVDRSYQFPSAIAGRRRVADPVGFTLLEMLVVLAIMSVLALSAVPMAELNAKRQKEERLRADLRQIRDAIDRYRRLADEGRIDKPAGSAGYPVSLDVLVDGVVDRRDPAGRKIYLLRRVPTDPMASPGVVGADSWGTRSYASPHDSPTPGDDVFDVHSLSAELGINGIPYRHW